MRVTFPLVTAPLTRFRQGETAHLLNGSHREKPLCTLKTTASRGEGKFLCVVKHIITVFIGRIKLKWV